MSIAARSDTQSPEPHVADSHDRIRVHGARVNNLRDVSLELPKRRLTVFTGVSGSGKSSLVFDTIAAESQRMINETYSAFVQGFMPTLARPEVDVLDGLTTAIIVDQERMGANVRSTVGTPSMAALSASMLSATCVRPRRMGLSTSRAPGVPPITVDSRSWLPPVRKMRMPCARNCRRPCGASSRGVWSVTRCTIGLTVNERVSDGASPSWSKAPDFDSGIPRFES